MNTFHDDLKKQNYLKKIVRMAEAGKISMGDFMDLEIFHEKHCPFHGGGICNCDPVIKIDGKLRTE